MKTRNLLLGSLALIITPVAYADGDLSRENVQTVVLEMGTNTGGMYFKPNHLELKTGQAYKLKHEVDAGEFIEKIYTRKVEVKNKQGGLVAEIKGSIREIEIGPMAEVEWYVVPVQPGKNMEMICALKGHKEAGMHGTITVK